MPQQQPALPYYERLLALGLAGCFIFITILNLMLDEGEVPDRLGEPHYLKNPLIEISIEGKVQKPGTYQVEKGSSLKAAIELADPLPDAKLNKNQLNAVVQRRRKVIIK